jgi:cytochrome c oxidase assembly protein subunit 11
MPSPRPPRFNVVLVACIGCVLIATIGTAMSSNLLHAFDNAAGFEGHMDAVRTIGPLARETGEPIFVRIDTNVMPGLDWHMHAEQGAIHAEIGVPTIAYLDVRNLGASRDSARGLFSVTPDPASYHFMKADNFTSGDVTLDPGESVRLPVAFYFDGTTATDPEMKGIRSATVAYTFVRAKGGATTTPLAALAATAAQDVAVNARVTFSADPAR